MISPRQTRERVIAFRHKFGDSHYWFACHAAFPLGMTPDLLYRCGETSQLDERGTPTSIPWIAVSDLLLSEFSRPVGPETFEMAVDVQALLLDSLQREERFGPNRIANLRLFIGEYYKEVLSSPSNIDHAFAGAQALRRAGSQLCDCTNSSSKRAFGNGGRC